MRQSNCVVRDLQVAASDSKTSCHHAIYEKTETKYNIDSLARQHLKPTTITFTCIPIKYKEYYHISTQGHDGRRPWCGVTSSSSSDRGAKHLRTPLSHCTQEFKLSQRHISRSIPITVPIGMSLCAARTTKGRAFLSRWFRLRGRVR